MRSPVRITAVCIAIAGVCAAAPAAWAGSETFVYAFKGGTADGHQPNGDLLYANGIGYGETATGGTHHDGTVYSISASGVETVLYSFGAVANDGIDPDGGLIAVDGVLYGVASQGGAHGHGTVFAVTTAGAESTLYDFAGSPSDGAGPETKLLFLGGTFYGTTDVGGGAGYGTVFSLTPGGVETVLHSFAGGSGDGAEPISGLLALNGTLYGATYFGGGSAICEGNGDAAGCGTIYAIAPSGSGETVLHAFDTTDGAAPDGGLTAVSGVLYGTTSLGGSANMGTVYRLVPAGGFTTLAQFTNGQTAANPTENLTYSNGLLYGVAGGGADECGSLYSVTLGGTLAPVFGFSCTSSGHALAPSSSPLALSGTLYGTTFAGGGANEGTLYGVTP